MNLEQMQELAARLVEEGYADNQDANTIKTQMIVEGIDYGKVNKLYKDCAIDLGLMVDPKEITVAVVEAITDIDFSQAETWDQVEQVIAKVASEVDGATEARVTTIIRAHCRDEEIVLPKKPAKKSGATGSRGGKIVEAVVALVNDNPSATRQDCYNALEDLVGGEKKHDNILYYVNLFFTPCMAVRSSVTVAEMSVTLSTQPVVTPDSVVEEATEEFEGEDELA